MVSSIFCLAESRVWSSAFMSDLCPRYATTDSVKLRQKCMVMALLFFVDALCDSPEDEGDAKTETTPGESSQLMESGAEMPDKVVQQSSQDLNRSNRHPCGFRTKPTVPSQESKRPTRREVIEISFDEIKRSCLVRFRSPDFRPFTESRGQENDDECASGSESSSTLEDGRPKVGHPKEPATGGGCAGKRPSGVTIEPGRDKVHLTTSSCPRSGTIWQRRSLQKASREDPHPIEPRTHSSSASKEPGGGNNEPGTTQRGSKRRQGSSPVVQPGIPSDGETKGDLRDCSFAPARKSKEKNLNSSSEAKDKLGVG
ncbi:hypothetical protein HPB47_005094 [Ixodes persulcatus]|uniref:Uncharacterized protein n=1 Tax=Ixodes persulcatus TaxID=34615 RepID=A0AC60PE20_IXOPE|nr:hypothetical protein HPB47_005094 [Ixodes persulcatus]